MSNYLKATDFGSKDALLSGDPNKIVKGTEINDEFDALQTAVNSKANKNNAALTGIPTAPTAVIATNTTQIATTAFVKAQQGAIAITGGSITGTAISGLTSPLEVASGGTGLTTVGTDGQVLTSTGTEIAWETPEPGYTDADVKSFLNATGSAPIYACRGWANVSGESTIRASGNIASISGSGGIYTVTFGSALPDANYAVVISASNNSSSAMSTSGHTTQVYNQTTTSFQIALWNYVGSNNTSSRTSTGLQNMGIAVFR